MIIEEITDDIHASCEEAIVHLNKIFTRSDDAFNTYEKDNAGVVERDIVDYWSRSGIYENLMDLVSEEIRLYVEIIKLKHEYTVKTKTRKLLKNIIQIDKPSEKKKRLIPNIILSTVILHSYTDVRIKTREILQNHWDLYNYITNTRISFPDALKCQIIKIKNILDDLSWLFRVFISYASENKNEIKLFMEHSKQSLKSRNITLWRDDAFIVAGQNVLPKILYEIDRLDIAILFVSRASMKSPFINSNEIPPILENKIKEGMILMPLILEKMPDKWNNPDWLKKIHCRPKGSSIKEQCGSSAKLKEFYLNFSEEIITNMDILSNLDKFRKKRKEGIL